MGAMSEDVKIDNQVVGERIGLEIGPEVFDRDEFGGVRREVFQMCRAGQDALVEECAFGLETIPDEHDRRSQLPLQMFEETHGALGSDVGVSMQPKPKAIRSLLAGCTARRWRRLSMAAAALPQYGVATHAPGAPHQGAVGVPDWSRKTIAALSRVAFFLLEASLARSRPGSLLVALDGAPGRLLGMKPRPCSRRLTCAG